MRGFWTCNIERREGRRGEERKGKDSRSLTHTMNYVNGRGREALALALVCVWSAKFSYQTKSTQLLLPQSNPNEVLTPKIRR